MVNFCSKTWTVYFARSYNGEYMLQIHRLTK